jgi:hypothetical protein
MLVVRNSGSRPGDALSFGSFWYCFGLNLLSFAGALAAAMALSALMMLSLPGGTDQGFLVLSTPRQPAAAPQSGPATFADRFPLDSRPSATVDASVLSPVEAPEKQLEEHLAMHGTEPEEPMPGSGAERVPEARPSAEAPAAQTREIENRARPGEIRSRAGAAEAEGRASEKRIAKKQAHQVEPSDRSEPSRAHKVARKLHPRPTWMAREEEAPREGPRRRHVFHSSSAEGGVSLPASLRP